MNAPVTLSIAASMVGLLVALLGWRIGSAPGWAQYRALSFVAASAAVYCGLDAFSTAGVSAARFVAITHVENAVATLHCVAWHSYVQRRVGGVAPMWYRIVRDALLVVAGAWLLPGVLLDGAVSSFEVPWLGVRYDIATASTLGSFTFAALLTVLVLAMVRCLRTARAGRDGPVHALALGAIVVTAMSDSLVASGIVRWPLLLSFGFLGSVGALGWALTRDFVASARELDRISRELESLVEKRTKDLFASEAALLRAEKMAAVGQLSAGVAHEINNPAAALSANLAYLRETVGKEKVPADARECIEESQAAVDRIAKIVAQLLDSTRAAAHPNRPDGSVSVLEMAQTSLAMSKARIGTNVTTLVEVDRSLFVRGEESALGQVLVNLIVNAAQAIPKSRAGHIALRAIKVGKRVRIEIQDDGTGMTAETERRLFEPFFTTKAHGEGTGLGLTVSLGLVRSMGGELSVVTSAAGTTMSVVLDAAAAPAGPASVRRERTPGLQTLLVVDDDVAVGRAVARTLRARVKVEVASGVEDAREKLRQRPFDLVLSDLQMPAGGGRRLYELLLAEEPEIARRVVFISGGSPSPADAAFIARARIPLLTKPLVVEELFAVAEKVVEGVRLRSA